MQRLKEIVQKTCVANWKAALCARGAQRRKEIRAKPCVAAKWGYCEMGAIDMGQYGLGNVRGVKNILLFLQGRLERCGCGRL